mgnify:CR=1 FL=1
MDEPFSAVDALTRVGLQELVRSLWRELGLTVVFVTHDVDEGIYLSSRVVALSRAPARHRNRSARSSLRTPRDQIVTRACPNISSTAGVCWRNSLPTRARGHGGGVSDTAKSGMPAPVASPSEAGRRHCLALEDPLASASASSCLLLALWELAAAERLGALDELSAHERGAGRLVGADRLR